VVDRKLAGAASARQRPQIATCRLDAGITPGAVAAADRILYGDGGKLYWCNRRTTAWLGTPGGYAAA
jgi:hypothetical protein